MSHLLLITASARHTRSLTRMMLDDFLSNWRKRQPDVIITLRDVGRTPPPILSEDWIAAAFCKPDHRTDDQQALLALSDTLIDEIAQASHIIIATPMYNYGMPAALKAWVDQVVRINKTFSFDLGRGDTPLEPLFSGKKMVILSSSGEFGFAPGGSRDHMDHLTPHLKTVSKYLGVDEVFTAAIEYQEFGDARHQSSIDAARQRIADIVQQLTD